MLPHQKFDKLMNKYRKETKQKNEGLEEIKDEECYFCKSENNLKLVQVEKKKKIQVCKKCREKPAQKFEDYPPKKEYTAKEKEDIKNYYKYERWGISKESMFLDSDSD